MLFEKKWKKIRESHTVTGFFKVWQGLSLQGNFFIWAFFPYRTINFVYNAYIAFADNKQRGMIAPIFEKRSLLMMLG